MKTCATCIWQVKRDRNCQILLLPAHVELALMQAAGNVTVPRPGDDRFICGYWSPAAKSTPTPP